MELGNILAQLRNQKGLNQREFAKALGVSNGAVAMWETNKRQPDLEMIKKMSSFFNVPVDRLLGNNSPTDIFAESQKSNYFFFFFDDSNKNIFADRIKAALAEIGLTENEFIEQVSIGEEKAISFLSANGEPTAADLIAISQFLETSIDYLLGQIPKIGNAEKKLLNAFTKLNTDYKDIIIGKTKELLVKQKCSSVAANEHLERTGTDNPGK